jgi:predicted Zn-dependent peptidase
LSQHYETPSTYRKTVLDNGLRVVTEEIAHLKSVSIGIWVRSGSRFERPRLNGICHFIEHMLFKGTQRRSAYAIAKEIDSVGGILNAFTSKEMTCFYCKVVDENLELAVDLLSDIFINASFPDEEIEREKLVICQEINQVADSPEDLIHEELGMRFWQDDPLGQPILGTIPTVVKLDRDTMMQFKNRYYSPEETIVCATGSLDHDRLVDLIAKEMGSLRGNAVAAPPSPEQHRASSHVIKRELEQAHILVGLEAPSAVDDERHAAYVVNTLLGGGMSSRLFQEIREKRGLAYSVYSFLSTYSDTGLFGLYAGCDPKTLDEVVTLLKDETRKLASSITEDEVRTSVNQIKGNIILSMESSDSVMNRLAKGEYYFGRYVPLEEVIESLDSITPLQVSQTADKVINSKHITCLALGPFDEQSDPMMPLLG